MRTDDTKIQTEETLNFDFDLGNTLDENQPQELRPLKIIDLSTQQNTIPSPLTGKVITIEIENSQLRVVKFTLARKKFEILDFSETLLPVENSKRFPELLSALQHAFPSRSSRKGRVVLSLSGPDIITRKIQVPLVNKKQLPNVVLWQLKKDSANFDESQIWDFEVIGQHSQDGKEMLDILTAVVPETFARKYLNLLASVNVFPSQVVIKSMALKQAFNYAQTEKPTEQNKVSMIAEINHESTHLCFIRNGHLEFSRTLNLGSDMIDRNLSKPLRFREQRILPDNNKLQNIKKKHGILPAFISGTNKTHFPFNQIYHAIYPVLQQFVSEFRRTLTYYENTFHGNEIENIVLTGNGCQLKNFDLFIEHKLGYKTQSLIPTVDHSGEPLFEYTSALGAALCEAKKMNFIPPMVVKTYRHRSAQMILNVSVLLLAIILSASTYLLFKNANDFENVLTQMDLNYTNLQPAQVNYLKIEKELSNVQATINLYKRIITPSPLIVEVLKLVSSTLPEDLYLTRLDFFNGDAGQIFNVNPEDENILFIDAAVHSNFLSAEITLFEYMKTLKDCGAFESVELSDKKSKINRKIFKFSLKCRLK